MDFLGWVILFVVVVVSIAIIQIAHTSNKKKGMEEKLANLTDFSSSQKVMGEDGNAGIAVDEGRKRICLIKQSRGNIKLDVLSYRDILSSEVFEDGVTVTKTARGSQLGGALIGGLALGGVGAIIGGLSGKKTSSNKVNRVDLRITVNRTANPLHDINFMNVEARKNGFIYNSAMEKARRWHGLLEVLIKRADSEDAVKEDVSVEDNKKQVSHSSVADELAKLAELLRQGLLTEDEFKTQKAKLLERNI